MIINIRITCQNLNEANETIQKLIDNNNEPTDKQLNLMKKLNIPIPDGLTKTQASDMIQEYFNKQKE
jgi:hypothetical protein